MTHTPAEALREALADIANARMLWNGGVARRHRPQELQDFIDELQGIAIRALATPSPPPDEGVPADVAELVIAARIVAFEDQSPEALRALDKASEAFAERVPWDNEPEPTLDELAHAIAAIKTDEPVQELHELPAITHEMVSAATKEIAWALEIDNTIGLRATVKASLKAALKARPVPPDVSGVVERLEVWLQEHLLEWKHRAYPDLGIKDRAFIRSIATLLLSLASERDRLKQQIEDGRVHRGTRHGLRPETLAALNQEKTS